MSTERACHLLLCEEGLQLMRIWLKEETDAEKGCDLVGWFTRAGGVFLHSLEGQFFFFFFPLMEGFAMEG